MEMCSGPPLQVILAIKAARGFGYLENTFIIEANLNGHNLQTDAVQSSDEISVGAELLWEAERKTLRRLRTGNVPVKVECFVLVNGKKHERLGYILLNLRTARIVAPNKQPSVPGIWHVLLGVKADVKTHRPELLLAFCIEDSNISEMPSANMKICNPTYIPKNKYTPKLMKNEGLIQLGPLKNSGDIFLLTISIEEALHLNLIAEPECLSGNGFYFSCDVMGFSVQAGAIPELSAFKSLAKVIMKIRSSLEILREYFLDTPVITIKVMMGENEIGFCDVDVSSLIPSSDLKTFCTQHANNNVVTIQNLFYLVKSSVNKVPVSSDGLKPYANVAVHLKYTNGDENQMSDQGDADQQVSNSTCGPLVHVPRKEEEEEEEEELGKEIQTLEQAEERLYNGMHNFSIVITVESVLFYCLPPRNTFYIRFSHTEATVKSKPAQEVTVDGVYKTVELQDVECTVSLEGPLEELQRVLLTQPPKVLLCGSPNNPVPFAKGSVDLGLLLVSKQKECSYNVELLGTLEDIGYGVLQVKLRLDDALLTNYSDNKISSSSSLLRTTSNATIVDDSMAVKIVAELEEWKMRQAEVFLMELKKKEQARLEAAVAAWEGQRTEFEQTLNAHVEHCASLAASLTKAREELQSEKDEVALKEKELSDMKVSLQNDYQFKIHECKEVSRRMEDDLKLEISHLIEDKESQQKEVKLLEKQNENLCEAVRTLQEELNRRYKTLLAEDQTIALLKELKLLQEKYEMAQRSKLFFKEQWARSVREIHCIKSKNCIELSTQIKSKREVLQHFGLPAAEHDVETSSTEGDLQTLPVNTHTPFSSSMDITDQTAHLQNIDGPIGTVMSMASQQERLLQELVEERDSLLNTGSYSLDHEIINSLNMKIRFLLTESGDKFE